MAVNKFDDIDGNNDMHTSANADQVDGLKTKYQLEKDAEQLQNNPLLVQTLLDASSVFRSRTALPHGLLFDLYKEVYPIIEDLLEEYLNCLNTFYFFKRKDSDMDALVEDTKVALISIGKHIGEDCDGINPEEYSTNRIYSDAITGIFHNISTPDETDEFSLNNEFSLR